MPRSKKIFLLFIALFIIMIGYLIYDISSRTTFPGSKSQQITKPDTTAKDSIKSVHR
jgi:zona occludens toxin (predicted ATPase)